jgi:lysophospholipase L1-like esterase
MKKELSYDGVHLNDKGYSVWVDHIKPTVLNLANHN